MNKIFKINIALILFIFVPLITKADEDILLFKPFIAPIFEPRIGTVYDFDDEDVRLDIGASFDLLRAKTENNSEFSVGADFFTYTRLRSEKNFKFPVETSDYYFGVNAASKFKLFEQDFSSRLRVAHISSHLVDGYSEDGVFYKKPYVFSREFTDLSLVYNKNSDFIDYRIYAGLVYVFHTMPSDANEYIPYLGVDFNKDLLKYLAVSGGIDIRRGEEKMTNIAAQIGLNLKLFKKFGIFVGYYKYFGSSIHGMFYKERDNYDGIGFQIIYF